MASIQNFGEKRGERKKCNRMGETRKKESERSVNWKCEERMPNEKLGQTQTARARPCGRPAYPEALRDQALPAPVITGHRAALLNHANRRSATDGDVGAAGKHRCSSGDAECCGQGTQPLRSAVPPAGIRGQQHPLHRGTGGSEERTCERYPMWLLGQRNVSMSFPFTHPLPNASPTPREQDWALTT